MAIVCIGVALAKNVFAIHGVDDVGKAVPDWRDPSAKSLLLRRARRMLGPPASGGCGDGDESGAVSTRDVLA